MKGRVAKLAAEDHSVHRGSVTQGRSLELKALLAEEDRWSYDWVCEEPVGVLKIGKDKFMAAVKADPELHDYLQKMTLNLELQRFRNDIRLCRFDSEDIRKTLSRLSLVMDAHSVSDVKALLLIVKKAVSP